MEYQRTLFSGITLNEAKTQMMAEVKDGTTCPCCERFIKVYKRALNSTMAAGLIWLCRKFEIESEGGDIEWIHLSASAPRFVIATNQLGTLMHWSLIERAPNEDKSKRTSGLLRPTKKGMAFVHFGTRLPRHVYLLNNLIHGFSDEMITIKQALGKKFDYSELMRT